MMFQSVIPKIKKLISQATCKTGLKMSSVQSGRMLVGNSKTASVAVRNPQKASSEKIRRT